MAWPANSRCPRAPCSAPIRSGRDQEESPGGGNFRVEEYKKPEFEVTVDAPKEPVRLGDKIDATIKAKYYFGSPVTSAKVKYKVLRSSYSIPGIRAATWDWFYGRVTGGSPPTIRGIPAWTSGAWKRPMPVWWGRWQEQPEVVLENEVRSAPTAR